MSGACDAITSANRLIGQHLRAGRVDAVQEVFYRMPQRDVVSWNSLMAAYTRSGVHDSAVTAFLEMRREGFCVDNTTFSTVLSA
ncbi:hypothetical protein GHO42_07115, partial [Pseudomonas sp. FSL R10-0056]|nr:hypothetical protein [Pseudomonas sp. FSL R10-0056]